MAQNPRLYVEAILAASSIILNSSEAKINNPGFFKKQIRSLKIGGAKH